MRDTPNLGRIKEDSGKRWHIGRDDNFYIESYCERRFTPHSIGWKFNDWVWGDNGESVNLCEECRIGWELRTERVTELNSMFNLPDERLAPAGPDVSFSDWLVEADAQAGHINSI